VVGCGRVVRANGLQIYYDVTGDPDGVPVVLLHGIGLTAAAWGPEFVDPLVAQGYRLIRIDSRDSGRSDWVDYHDQPYDVRDLAADTCAVLDAAGIASAHIVGFTMGAMVGQQVAIEAPERVRTLTALMSMTELDLARLTPRGLDVLGILLGQPGKSRRRDAADWAMKALRAMAGDRIPFDPKYWRDVLDRVAHAGENPACSHAVAVTRTPSQFDRLAACGVPTLFIHADDDPLFPLRRIASVAASMPNARVVVVRGAGRDMNPAIAAEVVPPLLDHIAKGEASAGISA